MNFFNNFKTCFKLFKHLMKSNQIKIDFDSLYVEDTSIYTDIYGISVKVFETHSNKEATSLLNTLKKKTVNNDCNWIPYVEFKETSPATLGTTRKRKYSRKS